MNRIRVRRWIVILLGLCALMVAVGVGVVLLRNQIARFALEKAVAQRTGWKTSVGAVKLGISDGSLQVENLRIHNPESFGGGMFLNLPELYLAYDAVAAATNALRLRELRLNLSEVQVVVDARGRTNVTELQSALGSLDSVASTNRTGSMKFAGIDTLVLTVGRVIYRDLRPGGGTRIFSAGLKNETLRQVNGWIDLFPLAMKLFFAGKVTEGAEPMEQPANRPPVSGGTSVKPRQ